MSSITQHTPIPPTKSPIPSFDEENLATLVDLKQEVADNEAAFAIAQANSDSLAAKAALFQSIFDTATANRDNAFANYQLVRTAAEATDAALNTSTNLVNKAGSSQGAKPVDSDSIFAKVYNMCNACNTTAVVVIQAAKEISLLNALVKQKKAKNPVLREEIVTSSANLVKDAEKAVTAIVLALESSYTALKLADTYIRSAVIVQQEAEDLQVTVGEPQTGNVKVQPTLAQATFDETATLISQLDSIYQETLNTYNFARNASMEATQSAEKAAADLKRADARLVASQAAFEAAKSALGVKSIS